MKPIFSAFVLGLALSPVAFAFHVPEHRAITDRAINGLQKCGFLPSQWDKNWNKAIADGNELEDTDLARKWGKYSHFYNPYHGIKQNRVDSSVTITESEQDVLKDPNEAVTVNLMVGRIVHHIQDSSVPAHAIPVMHAMTDGFESFTVPGYFAEELSIGECPALVAAEPMEILHDNAAGTLANIEQQVIYSIDGANPQSAPWLGTFWMLGKGEEFGSYGPFGDRFGVALITLKDKRKVAVDPTQYVALKRAGLDMAVRSTQKVILWLNKVRGF